MTYLDRMFCRRDFGSAGGGRSGNRRGKFRTGHGLLLAFVLSGAALLPGVTSAQAQIFTGKKAGLNMFVNPALSDVTVPGPSKSQLAAFLDASPAELAPFTNCDRGLSLADCVAQMGDPTAREFEARIGGAPPALIAAIQLGKALFWDMSVGSDGIQACASCHFRAGADPRSINELSPGFLAKEFAGGVTGSIPGHPDHTFQLGQRTVAGGDANYMLDPSDFPFASFEDKLNPFVGPMNARIRFGTGTYFALDGDGTYDFVRGGDPATILGTEIPEVTSSMGAISSCFTSVTPGDPVDTFTVVPDVSLFDPVLGGPVIAPDGTSVEAICDLVPLDPVFVGGLPPVFQVNSLNNRRVEPRNTPTMINAVFNPRNFLDGRANACFNGVSPFGPHDTSVVIWSSPAGAPADAETVCQDADFVDGDGDSIPDGQLLDLSSLASQAVGPPLSDFEMSASGRIWPEVGKKLVRHSDGTTTCTTCPAYTPGGTPEFGPAASLVLPAMQPLLQQVTDSMDSVLGSLVPTSGPGLVHDSMLDPMATIGTPLSYADMIRAAFKPEYWRDDVTVTLTGPAGTPVPYSLMEANFSLFFGLAVQLYESTLVADNSRFNQAVSGTDSTGGTPYTLSASEQRGLEIFTNFGQNPNPAIPVVFCSACHLGPEFTGAGITAVGLVEPPVPGLPPAAPEFLIERMPSGVAAEIGAIVLSTDPLPGEDPFPNLFDPILNPTGIDWTNKDTSPLRGEIRVASTCGLMPEVVFTGKLGGGVLKKVGVKVKILKPKPILADDPTVIAAVLKFADGNVVFEMEALNLDPGPSGSCVYNVTVGGEDLFALDSGLFITAVPNIIYDLGFYNISVTHFLDDLGVAGTNPDGHSLSFAQQLIDLASPMDHIRTDAEKAHINAGIPPVFDPATGLALEFPVTEQSDLDRQAAEGFGAMVDGAIKVPGLFNVGLTAPYFHNGGKKNLCEVMDFYNRGGDFRVDNLSWLDPDIAPLGMTPQDISDVVRFMLTLTDDRVFDEVAPFEHPQLFVPNGHLDMGTLMDDDTRSLSPRGPGADGVADEDADDDGMADFPVPMAEIPAVGAGGKAAFGITSPFELGFLDLGDGLAANAECLIPEPAAGSIFEAILLGDKKLVQQLIKADPGLVTDRNSLGQTPLITAAVLGQGKIVNELTKKKVVGGSINLRDGPGLDENTALFYVIGDPKISKKLIKIGATL